MTEARQPADLVRWEVARCVVASGIKEDQETLETLLRSGWEPFAVTASGGAGHLYHFRRAIR